MESILILESENFSVNAITLLEQYFHVFRYGIDFYVNENIVAIFCRLHFYLDDHFLSPFISLRYICSPATGLTHFASSVFANKKYTIFTLRDYPVFLKSIRASPEFCFSMILNALRNQSNSISDCQSLNWNRDHFLGEELFQNSVGLIGYGRIGQQLHKYFKAFDTNVFIYDIKDDFKSISVSSMSELINLSNIVVLCASHSVNSSPILKKEHLLSLKDKHFVNISRGELVDQESLIDLISLSHFKSVSLDVLQDESSKSSLRFTLSKLAEFDNVFITPHIGGYTLNSLNRTEYFIANLFLERYFHE